MRIVRLFLAYDVLKPAILEPDYYLDGFVTWTEVVKVLNLLGFQREGGK